MTRMRTALVLLAASLAAGPFAPPAGAQAIAVASVNGVDIPHERLERGFEEELRNRKMNLLQIRNPHDLVVKNIIASARCSTT